MALRKCLDCGREVSDTAKRCPSCGRVMIVETTFGSALLCGFIIVPLTVYALYKGWFDFVGVFWSGPVAILFAVVLSAVLGAILGKARRV